MKRLLPAVVFFFLFASCETDITMVRLAAVEKLPTESGTEVELIYSDSSKVKVKLFAPKLDRYEVPQKMLELPQGVFMEFFDDSLNVITRLRANYGVSYEGEEKMEVRKNVIVVNKDNERLNTEHLIWSQKDRKIYTDGRVTITTEDDVTWGDGFEASDDFSKYKIINVIGTNSFEVDQDSTSND